MNMEGFIPSKIEKDKYCMVSLACEIKKKWVKLHLPIFQYKIGPDVGSILGLGRSPGEGKDYPFQY